jgi:hypothetical protein
MSVRSWMWSSLSLALLVGVGLGVIADRVLLSDAPVYADARVAPHKAGAKASPFWFICDARGSIDIEDEPGYLYSKNFRDQLLEGLSSELGLTADQHAAMSAFLEQRRPGAHEFWERSRHSYCEMRDGFRADLRAMLDETQQARFDALMFKIDEHQAEYAARVRASQQAPEGGSAP